MRHVLIGATVGAYRIAEQIAVGGMGSVYRAVQTTTQRDVALKILRPELLDAGLARRFALEIEVLGQLEHPNIARVYGGGEETLFSTRVPYFAMELIPHAQPISAFVVLRQRSIEARLRLFLQACSAVTHAHNRGIIHRDLKPENILVDGEAAEPRPKVIDFGIARHAGRTGETALTHAGEIMGSLDWMSPEQAVGNARAIDVRTDVYGLSAVLYQMLTGTPPLPTGRVSVGEAVRIITEVLPEAPSRHAPGLRPELDAIVLKGLSKRPEDRYESVRAMAEDVAAFLEGRTIKARAPGTFELLLRSATRYRKVLIPAALALLLALTATAVSTRYAVVAGRSVEQMNRLAYRTSLNAASAAVRDWKEPAARGFLEHAPEHLRGWEWEFLRQRTAPKHRSLGMLPSVCTWFAMSPRGDLYAVGSRADSSLHVYDADTGETISRTPDLGFIYSLAFEDADHLFLHAISGGQNLYHRVSTRGEILESWPVDPLLSVVLGTGGHSPVRRNPAYSPERGGLVADVIRSKLVLYRISDRRVLWDRDVSTFDPWEAFTSDGTRVASSQRESDRAFVVRIYDTDTGRELHRLEGPSEAISRMIFTPDDRLLVGACADGRAYVWEPLAGPSPAFDFEASGKLGLRAAISQDGRIYALSSIDGRTRYWDLETRRLIGVFNAGTPQTTGLWFRAGTDQLYAAAGREPVKVWDVSLEYPTLLATHASYVYGVEVAESQGLVVSGGWDGYAGATGSLRWTALESHEPVAQLGPAGAVVLDAELSRDETEVLVSIYTPPASGSAEAEALDQNSADGNRLRDRPLIAEPGTGLLARVSMATQEVLQTYALPKTIHFLATDPAYRRAVLGDRFGKILVIDLADGTVLHQTEPGYGEARDRSPVAWSSDGRWIAVARSQERIQIWDAETYTVHAEFGGHEDWIWSLAFDRAGTRLLSASNDQTVGVWSVPAGRPLAKLRGHGAGVLCAKFDPSEDRIVCGARGGQVWFWRTDDYTPIVSLKLHDAYVYDLEWTADGHRLITGSGDGTVRIWDGTPRPPVEENAARGADPRDTQAASTRR